MARISNLVPLLLSIGAFVMALLILLAGKDTSFLTNIYLLRIDTSNITPSNIDTSLLDSFGVNIPPQVESVLDDLPDELIDSLANTAAESLGLKDFYTAHIMTYCSGLDFIIDKNGPNQRTERRVTFCSNPEGLNTFNPVDIFEAELVPGVTVQDLGIPDEVDPAIEALEIAYKTMFVTYIIGVSLSGLLILISLLAGWFETRIVAFVSGTIAFLGFVSLGVASGIATAFAVKVRDVFNDYMVENLNVRAEESTTFLALTWAATACILLVFIYWAGACCFGGSRRTRKARKDEEKYTYAYGGSS